MSTPDRCWIITDPTGREADVGGRTYHYGNRESAESDLQRTAEASALAGPHKVRRLPEACVIVTSKCGYTYDKDGEGVEHLAPADVEEMMRDAGWRRLPDGKWHCGGDLCDCGPLPQDDDRRPMPGQLALIEESNYGTWRRVQPPATILAYLATIVAANSLTARYGVVPVGIGLSATAGTITAGLAFVARDAVQDLVGRIGVVAALLAGSALSWWLSTPALAVASAAAFGLSELVDMAIYTPLRRRGYVRAAIASNLVGSVVDTFVFLGLAGFGLAPLVIAGQLLGKGWATLAVVGAVVVTRAVLRHRVRAEGA